MKKRLTSVVVCCLAVTIFCSCNKNKKTDLETEHSPVTTMQPKNIKTIEKKVNNFSFQIPETWTEKITNDFTYYYADTSNFLMIQIDGYNENYIPPLSETFFNGIIDGMSEYEMRFNGKENKITTIGGITGFKAELADENNTVFLFIFSHQGYANAIWFNAELQNTATYRPIFEEIIQSIKVFDTPTPVPTATPVEQKQTEATTQNDDSSNANNESKKTYNSPKINKSEFEQLKTGMSYEAVVEIIGGRGEILSESNIDGSSTVMYSWEGEGDIGANANAVFQNGKLVTKAQAGLN